MPLILSFYVTNQTLLHDGFLTGDETFVSYAPDPNKRSA